MKIRTGKKRIDAAALISFTDVVFLLIIFLLLSSSFVNSAGFKVELPLASTAQNQNQKSVEIALTRNGELYLNLQPVHWDTLPDQLLEYIKADPNTQVVIRADKHTELELVLKVIDCIRKAGAENFVIAADKNPS